MFEIRNVESLNRDKLFTVATNLNWEDYRPLGILEVLMRAPFGDKHLEFILFDLTVLSERSAWVARFQYKYESNYNSDSRLRLPVFSAMTPDSLKVLVMRTFGYQFLCRYAELGKSALNPEAHKSAVDKIDGSREWAIINQLPDTVRKYFKDARDVFVDLGWHVRNATEDRIKHDQQAKAIKKIVISPMEYFDAESTVLTALHEKINDKRGREEAVQTAEAQARERAIA